MQVLAMGDSYSAGNGAGDYSGAAGCYRSGKNYAQDFAAIIRGQPYSQPTTVTNVACSGAVTADFFHSKDGQPPEINAVTRKYDLIMLTIGGNDADFADIVKYCLVAKFRDGANCNPLLSNAEKLVDDGSIKNRITNVLASIRAKANPGAKIVLLGYPFLEGDTGYTLRSGHGDNAPIIKVGHRLHALGVAADALDQSVVNTLNASSQGSPFEFVSVHKLFDGPPYHGLYAMKNNPNRWMVQPFVDASLLTHDTWYHPNPTGWLEEAKLLVKTAGLPETPRPVIETTLPDGTVGQTYSAALTTIDHRVATWALVSGRLPPGLSLSGHTISGTPTMAGAYRFVVRVTDSQGRSVAATVSITIAGSWRATEVPLPADGVSADGSSMTAVACPSASACVAAGGYTDSSSDWRGMFLAGTGTSWRAVQAPLPTNALTGSPDVPGGTLGVSHIDSIACSSVAHCMAAGGYYTEAWQGEVLVDSGSGSSWRETGIPLPANANLGDWPYFPASTCLPGGDCVAAGYYADSSAQELGLLLTGSGSSWTAFEAPLPGGANVQGKAYLTSVGCSPTGTCTAVGTYTTSSGESEGLIITGSGATWKATEAPLPEAAGPNPYVTINSVGCPSADKCIAVGSYTDSSGNLRGLLLTMSGSTWKAADSPLPTNSAGGSQLTAVACPSSSTCFAVGNYNTGVNHGTGDIWAGLLLTMSGSSWKAAEVPLPPPDEGVQTFMNSIGCASATSCVAVGGYYPSSGYPKGVLLTLSGSAWEAAEAPSPQRPSYWSTDQVSVGCSPQSTCVVASNYAPDASGFGTGVLLTP